MEDFMNKVDNFSVDWDNFDAHQEDEAGDVSESDVFNQ